MLTGPPELLSYEQNKDSPSLSKAMMDLFYECIAGPPSDSAHSPLLALADKPLSLPCTYLQICGMDPLRDEAFLYARLSRERGVSTKVDIYPGLPHGFHQSYPQLEAVKTWEADVRAGLRWLLDGEV
ncbi:hypothetical protein DFH06DRAFT_1004148 [Mycena polygramma]|nr:hypothetical protein DFH06DRAFT_1004148 [Mycena polygramma]